MNVKQVVKYAVVALLVVTNVTAAVITLNGMATGRQRWTHAVQDAHTLCVAFQEPGIACVESVAHGLYLKPAANPPDIKFNPNYGKEKDERPQPTETP